MKDLYLKLPEPTFLSGPYNKSHNIRAHFIIIIITSIIIIIISNISILIIITSIVKSPRYKIKSRLR